MLTFFTGSHAYNAVLWTMWYEFIGSFIVFGLVALLLLLRNIWARCIVLLGALGLTLNYAPFFSCFIVGLILAVTHPFIIKFSPREKLPMRTLAVVCLSIVILIWGYHGPYKFYAFLGNWFSDTLTSKTIIFTGAAVLLMCLALYNPIISDTLDNRIGSRLGRLSFPIYLVHLLVICSSSSWLYLALHHHINTTILLVITFAATVLVTLAAAWPLSLLDQKLTAALDAGVDRLFAVAKSTMEPSDSYYGEQAP